MFKVICVDHVGIACKDLDISKKFYTEILGLPCSGEETVEEQGAKTVFIPCGETLLELLVDIEVKDVKHLNDIIAALKASRVVSYVARSAQ